MITVHNFANSRLELPQCQTMFVPRRSPSRIGTICIPELAVRTNQTRRTGAELLTARSHIKLGYQLKAKRIRDSQIRNSYTGYSRVKNFSAKPVVHG